MTEVRTRSLEVAIAGIEAILTNTPPVSGNERNETEKLLASIYLHELKQLKPNEDIVSRFEEMMESPQRASLVKRVVVNPAGIVPASLQIDTVTMMWMSIRQNSRVGWMSFMRSQRKGSMGPPK